MAGGRVRALESHLQPRAAAAAEALLDSHKGRSYPFRTTLEVRWGDMDAMRHVNNAVYFRFSEQARMDLVQRLGLIRSDGSGIVLAETSCRFKVPLRYPDRVTVGVSLLERNERGDLLQYLAIASHRQGVVAAELTARCVWTDRSGKRAETPPEVWERFAAAGREAAAAARAAERAS
eukprot:TRINITY_DN31801_c0_g1_i1.p2 TRINITY_DN31801_c0_g1~~TRINITY_DN31801_c0_g1_i1.p2  ORF type:complete len:202 (+),score=55.74 TRINITY_DN31801_c0_g1_i1:76-606(+)